MKKTITDSVYCVNLTVKLEKSILHFGVNTIKLISPSSSAREAHDGRPQERENNEDVEPKMRWKLFKNEVFAIHLRRLLEATFI